MSRLWYSMCIRRMLREGSVRKKLEDVKAKTRGRFPCKATPRERIIRGLEHTRTPAFRRYNYTPMVATKAMLINEFTSQLAYLGVPHHHSLISLPQQYLYVHEPNTPPSHSGADSPPNPSPLHKTPCPRVPRMDARSSHPDCDGVGTADVGGGICYAGEMEG